LIDPDALKAAHEAYHNSLPDGEKCPHLRAAIEAYLAALAKKERG
jgi:hypothetical protein